MMNTTAKTCGHFLLVLFVLSSFKTAMLHREASSGDTGAPVNAQLDLALSIKTLDKVSHFMSLVSETNKFVHDTLLYLL